MKISKVSDSIPFQPRARFVKEMISQIVKKYLVSTTSSIGWQRMTKRPLSASTSVMARIVSRP